MIRPGEFVRCPWHGWEYEIRSGQSYCDPKSVKVRQFKVTVEPGEDLVKGPYVVETFPVSVEESYLVVDTAGTPAPANRTRRCSLRSHTVPVHSPTQSKRYR